jgi:6-methylsalicylate decarboxylase
MHEGDDAWVLDRRELLTGAAAAGATTLLGSEAAVAHSGPRGKDHPGGPPPRGRYRVDLHAHLLPTFYREALARNGITNIGGVPIPIWSPEAHVAFMDAWGIAASVLSLSDPGVSFGDIGQTRELARQINEYSASLIRSQPNRFGAFAALPLPDVEAAAAEVRYALDTLKLDGVGMLSSFGGRHLGEPEFEPVYQELNARKAVVFVHPTAPTARPQMRLPYPSFLFEYPFDTTRAALNLMYSGVTERYPSIRWDFAHAGGTLPFLAFRIGLAAGVIPVLGQAVPDGPPAYFARYFYDTAIAQTVQQMEATREVSGVRQIVFGSDWPFVGPIFFAPDAVQRFPYFKEIIPRNGDPAPLLSRIFSRGERLRVDRLNALRLFPRLRRVLT